jgi:hypothetical protein
MSLDLEGVLIWKPKISGSMLSDRDRGLISMIVVHRHFFLLLLGVCWCSLVLLLDLFADRCMEFAQKTLRLLAHHPHCAIRGCSGYAPETRVCRRAGKLGGFR